jgi:secondary thiamine-phosphate synthase enzyme
MKTYQKEIKLPPYKRGFHLITRHIVDNFQELRKIQKGWLQVWIKHTSAGLTINENADPSVRADFETFTNYLIPEDYPHFIHTMEGPDDMPSHIRMALTRTSEVIPVVGGRMALGTWQGIFLFEHRRAPHVRQVVVSVVGG